MESNNPAAAANAVFVGSIQDAVTVTDTTNNDDFDNDELPTPVKVLTQDAVPNLIVSAMKSNNPVTATKSNDDFDTITQHNNDHDDDDDDDINYVGDIVENNSNNQDNSNNKKEKNVDNKREEKKEEEDELPTPDKVLRQEAVPDLVASAMGSNSPVTATNSNDDFDELPTLVTVLTQEAVPNLVASAMESKILRMYDVGSRWISNRVGFVLRVVSATDTNNDHDFDNDKLPTPIKVSEELCKIVSDRYSRDEALRALGKLFKWAYTEDPEILKYFRIHGGIEKVLDFLKSTMNDSNCVGAIRMECIRIAACVISQVFFDGKDGSNKEIATNIATCAMDYEGIEILINASEEYSGGDDIPQLNALESVWTALRNSTFKEVAMKNTISKHQAIVLFDTVIDILFQLKSHDGRVVSNTLEHAFVTLNNVVRCNYVEKEHFQHTNILSKCLNVFRKDGTWGDRSEKETRAALNFFDWCRVKQLLDDVTDYEILLPFVSISLKKFPLSVSIRRCAIIFIERSCDNVNDRTTIEKAGALEALSLLLTSDGISENEKMKVRALISNIIAAAAP